MAIVKPNELDFSNKKINMIVAGVPGIGKTTLALSSPKPLLIDLDKGISRVEAIYRKDTLMCSSYDELMSDLKNNDLGEYETLVIDTGGELLEMMKQVVIEESPKNAKSDGTLSLQGYGAIKRKFSDFMKWLKQFNKHVVLVFHATEVKLKDDTTGLRIRMEGSSKDEVWDDIDIGGFLEVRGNKRTISFSNCDRFYAKGTHSVHGTYDIPDLKKSNTKNNFVESLFKGLIHSLNEETKEVKECEELVKTYREKVKGITTVEEYNKVYQDNKKETHILTSQKEIGALLKNKCKEMGLSYDKERDVFNNAEPTE